MWISIHCRFSLDLSTGGYYASAMARVEKFRLAPGRGSPGAEGSNLAALEIDELQGELLSLPNSEENPAPVR